MKHQDSLFLETAYHVIRIILSPLVKLLWIKRVVGVENICAVDRIEKMYLYYG